MSKNLREPIASGRVIATSLFTEAFGTGLFLVSIQLIGDGLQRGAALDTAINANPTRWFAIVAAIIKLISSTEPDKIRGN